MQKSRFLKSFYFVVIITGLTTFPCFSINDLDYISNKYSDNYFPIATENTVSPIAYSENDFYGVIHAIENIRHDIEKVTGVKPGIYQPKMKSKFLIIAGTIGKNKTLDKLIKTKKINVSLIQNKWETFIIQVVNDPLPGIDKALIIIGSDKRGTIYGLYDLAEKIGVSPWNWWADVPVKTQSSIFVKPGVHSLGEPKVKYRGIFINDEAPALSGWVDETFGGFNHLFYEHVFDLILRLKGNFLWPAMWGKAFFDDDSLNAEIANKYGIVISTSHHEPMMRAHDEWRRYGTGSWNFETNKENLKTFWKAGIKRMGQNESIVTIGMRGDGDEPMSEETAISLLEDIVHNQRKIIEDVTAKPANQTPQVWALYKEVQEYYDNGMRVPDDVTLLLCDDNWGNVRILPTLDEQNRLGGYGMYYHFDYVGGPRSYKWLNTVQIERVWEQMNLTYHHGVNKIWLVNVGDIKPMELPIQFFLDFAWNPEKISVENLFQYYTSWSEQQFGQKYAKEIAEILALYTKYNSRRKPELLEADTYSLINGEADRISQAYSKLASRSKMISNKLPIEYQDAFFQLVQYPVEACANLNHMYHALAKNKLFAKQSRASTNQYADSVKLYFEKDIELTKTYHNEIADGKWNHMMSQIHIGYTYWNQPDTLIMPKVHYYQPEKKAKLGLTFEGTDKWWPNSDVNPILPRFDPINNQTIFIELFNLGTIPAEYQITSKNDWIIFTNPSGTVESEIHVDIQINWEKAPKGKSVSTIHISGKNLDVDLTIPIHNFNAKNIEGFIENNGVISIEAANFQKAKTGKNSGWSIVPNLGRTHSAVISTPADSKHEPLNIDLSAYLEYVAYFIDTGNYNLTFYLSPTLNYLKKEGLKFAVTIDNSDPVIINMHDDTDVPDWKYPTWWNDAVSNNIMKKSIPVKIDKQGKHTVKFWKIDPGIVLQKIVLVNQKTKFSTYLGPIQSYFIEKKEL